MHLIFNWNHFTGRAAADFRWKVNGSVDPGWVVDTFSLPDLKKVKCSKVSKLSKDILSAHCDMEDIYSSLSSSYLVAYLIHLNVRAGETSRIIQFTNNYNNYNHEPIYCQFIPRVFFKKNSGSVSGLRAGFKEIHLRNVYGNKS